MTSQRRRYIPESRMIEHSEVFELPGPRVCPLVRIRIGCVDGRWYKAADGGHQSGGFSGPLAYLPEQPERGAHPTREDAIAAAIALCRKQFGWAPKETVKHRAWLDELEEREFRQKDLFAGLGS